MALKLTLPSAEKGFLIPLCLPMNCIGINQVTTWLGPTIDVSRSLLQTWRLGAAPEQPRNHKRDSLLECTGQNDLPVATAIRGRRLPSLASLVANRCFFTFVRYSNLTPKIRHSSTGRNVVLLTNFYVVTTLIVQYGQFSSSCVRAIILNLLKCSINPLPVKPSGLQKPYRF